MATTQEKAEKIIQELREKTVRVETSEMPKSINKIDKKALWKKAQAAGRTISDDYLSTADTSRA